MLTELLTYFVNMPCLTLFLCTGYCIVVHSPVGVFIISFLCFLFLLVCLLFLSVRRFKLPQQQQHFYRLKRARERESEVCVREGDRAKDIGQRRVYYVRWLFLCAFCLFTVPPLFVQRNAQCERPGCVCSVAQCICISIPR